MHWLWRLEGSIVGRMPESIGVAKAFLVPLRRHPESGGQWLNQQRRTNLTAVITATDDLPPTRFTRPENTGDKTKLTATTDPPSFRKEFPRRGTRTT